MPIYKKVAQIFLSIHSLFIFFTNVVINKNKKNDKIILKINFYTKILLFFFYLSDLYCILRTSN